MKKELLEKIINQIMSTGASYGEIFYEDSKSKSYSYIDNNLDKVDVNFVTGVGLRMIDGEDVYYARTNAMEESNLTKTVEKLIENVNKKVKHKNIKLKKLQKTKNTFELDHQSMSEIEKKDYLKNLNEIIRSKEKRINQVDITLNEEESLITIVNHTGLYKQDEKMYTKLAISITFKDQEKTSTVFRSIGNSAGLELLNTDLSYIIDDMVKTGVDKLYAKPCIGKEMPVVIESGFGGVLFHEACGHAMEATSVADNLSVLAGKLNQKIASSKVTIIDDGTIKKEWGSSNIDDEGNKTKKNILIKDGYLVSYLVDALNSKKMNMKPNGCSRRESYKYAPTSRMSNTYLLPGNDKVEDMIKSIKLGLYAKSLGGGSVSPETGDFNFAVDDAYMIRDGKISECVKSASLIGNTLDILNNVEMVSDNLVMSPGMCGSASGQVPVTTGQPTIKLSKILVGGE